MKLKRAAHAHSVREDQRFLKEQLITCIGNKRHLLDFIGQGVAKVLEYTGKDKLSIFDAFSGSGVVSRYFKKYAHRLVSNDMELYAAVINRCYLANASEVPSDELRNQYQEMIVRLENFPLEQGFITELYAPADDANIETGDRVFYTNRNARYIDTARKIIDSVKTELRHFFLAPLLSEASIHANTAGVFKGFYKDASSGVGKFGGRNGDALTRICGDIHLPYPVFSNFECDVEIHQSDTNTLSRNLEDIDLTYIDPPYNQHPYGSNYFMLNLIADYRRPDMISKVSGIPMGWARSDYNKRSAAHAVVEDLVSCLNSRFLLISFNSEGFIRRKDMVDMLKKYGRIEILESDYSAFRGSRNSHKRDTRIKEYLYLLEKRG